MGNEPLPPVISDPAVGDLAGLGKIATALIGPITAGVGFALKPFQHRRENKAQIDSFNAWEAALAHHGLEISKVELSLAQAAEVRATAEKIVKQANRIDVAIAAIEHADHDSAPLDPSLTAPDPDWLGRFWRIAENISDEEVQRFFGTVLSRQAAGKAAISARALEFISLLSGEEAKALERIASFTVEIEDRGHPNWGVMHSIAVLNSGGAGPEAVARNARVTMHVQPLQADLFGSLGIFVQSGFANAFFFWQSGTGTFHFRVGGRGFKVTATADQLDEEGSFYLGSGYGLSPLGREIISMIRPRADEAYIQLLREAFELRGLQVIDVERGAED
jgi:hypothetical protein